MCSVHSEITDFLVYGNLRKTPNKLMLALHLQLSTSLIEVLCFGDICDLVLCEPVAKSWKLSWNEICFAFHLASQKSSFKVDETLPVISGLSDRFAILFFTFFEVIFVFGGNLKAACRINT